MSNNVLTSHHDMPPSSPWDRSRDNLMGANNDGEAMAMFLDKAGARSQETRRRYEREITRFTAYLYIEAGIDYAAVKLLHLQNYLAFIQALPNHWLAPGILPWQPQRVLFKGSIAAGKSVDQVIDVLSSFFSFLEKNRYIAGNPAVSLVRTGEKTARGTSTIRYFFNEEWQFIKQCLDNLPADTTKQQLEAARTRYIISLAYGLALRESELTGHSCADILSDNDGGYLLSVVGKGRKRRNLPINASLQRVIEDFRSLNGLQGLNDDALPLAPRAKKRGDAVVAMSSRGLRFWWQQFLVNCCEQADEKMVQRLQGIPFHALRHTALTHLAQKMDIEDLAIFAGHDSIQTTSQYYHAEAKRLKYLAADHGL